MVFSFPDSSAPSTPESRGAKGKPSLFADFANGPSTTPAGPPPSSAASFTPADPPPSTVFGSSHLGSQRSLFGSNASYEPRNGPSMFGTNGSAAKSKSPFGVDKDLFPSSAKSKSGSGGQVKTFQIPLNDDEDDADASGEDGEPELPEIRAGQHSDDDMDTGGDVWQDEAMTDKSRDTYDWMRQSDLLLKSSPQQAMRSSKRPRPSGGQSLRPRETRNKAQAAPARRKKSVIPAIATDAARQLGQPELHEPHDLILDTEREIGRLYADDNDPSDSDDRLEAALQLVPDSLARLWQRCCNQQQQQSYGLRNVIPELGPAEDAPSFHKAAFIASILLKLHHPPSVRNRQALMPLRSSRPLGSSFRTADSQLIEPYPKLLFDWLEEYHYPFRIVIAGLKAYQPNPTAHPNFWDLILSLTLRGRLQEALNILEDSDFVYASTAADEGAGDQGYSGAMLHMVLKEVNRAAETLRACPIVTDGDYDTGDFAWSSFRTKVEQAASQLKQATEGADPSKSVSAFDASAFSAASSRSDFGRSGGRSNKKHPKAVYRPLQELYGILLGKTDELMAASQDWVEASMALTAWWDGEEVELSQSLSSRPSLRLIDSNPGAAYRSRLAFAFDRVTSEDDGKDDTLQLDSSNPVEVGLAAVFEGDVEEALGLIRAFSVPIASAVVEIACKGGWYESGPSSLPAAGLSQDDMMVLAYGQTEEKLNRDDILLQYADMLAQVEELEESGEEIREGWSVAVEVLHRLDNTAVGEQRIGEIMGQLNVDSDERADRLIRASRVFGLDDQAYKIAERYGDHLAENTSNFGTAIVYYSRAHNSKKVKEVLDLLISYCLVESTAFPAASELDDHLRYLLEKPRDTLQHMRRNDPVAADILSHLMSGYATLRKFYELRDEEASGSGATLRPIARKKAAATALVAAVASSADAIQGGLFDRGSEAVISVDGLLVLLGEAMPLVDQRVRYLSLPQLLVLLRVIEDLQTVHPRVRAQCDECLRAALAAGRSGGPRMPAPRDVLKLSVANFGVSTGFALLGSVLAERRGDKGGRAEVARGWDWRRGLKAEQGADDVVEMLRLGLAREVARAWLEGEEL